MNFKQEYEKAFSDIKADENFKKNLVAMMDAESKKTKKKKTSAYIGVLAAAAVMVLVIGVGFMTGVLRGKTDQGELQDENQMVQNSSESQDNMSVDFNNEIVAGQDMSDTYMELNFSGLSWYGEAESDEELLTIFVSLMTGDDLDKIYCSNDDVFEENDLMKEEGVKKLVKRLRNAECTEKEYAGEGNYYKAVFKDGLTIKFRLSEQGYLMLQDTQTVYKIQ